MVENWNMHLRSGEIRLESALSRLMVEGLENILDNEGKNRAGKYTILIDGRRLETHSKVKGKTHYFS